MTSEITVRVTATISATIPRVLLDTMFGELLRATPADGVLELKVGEE